VFTDLTLQAIAEAKPGDTAGLLRINGVGQSKLGKYGDDVLALVAGSGADPGEPSGDAAGADIE
jgi:DNA helicase-2/ATP-dependent DNA helicase PcrA